MSNNKRNLSKSVSIDLIDLTETDENKYNLLKTCRLCLNEINALVSLFDKNKIDGQELLYSEMAVECASIKFDKQDKLPKVICLQCVKRLRNSYIFKKICKRSEVTLHNFLQKFEDESDDDPKTSEYPIEIEEHISIRKITEISSATDPLALTSTSNTSTNLLNEFQSESMNESITDDPLALNTSNPTVTLLNEFQSNENQITDSDVATDDPLALVSVSNQTNLLNEFQNNSEINIIDPLELVTVTNSTDLIINDAVQINSNEDDDPGNQIEYICNICNKQFSSPNFLKRHLQKIHKDKKSCYSCTKCPKTFKRFIDLQEHLRTHKEKNFQCDVCKKRFSSKVYFQKHMKSHIEQTEVVLMMKQETSSDLYQEHLRIRKEKKFYCGVCCKSFSNKVYFQRHLKSHNKQKNNQGTGSDFQEDLGGTRKEKKFHCEVCDKRFSNKVYFRRHLKSHIKPENVVSVHHLRHNQETTSGKKTYKCKDCGQAFYYLNVLQIHERTHHSAVKPYTCKICGRQFTRADHIRKHELSHSGKKPYKCNECGRSFADITYLKIHQRVHSGK